MKNTTRRIVYAGVCLALCFILPLITGNIKEIGNMLCPMHIPVILCGFLCGPIWGMTIGFTAPLLRTITIGMPPIYPTSVAMSFELAAYGAVAGVLNKRLPHKFGYTYVTLTCAMLSGRIVWGCVRYLMLIGGTDFSFTAFITGAFVTAWPGIVAQLILIPIIVTALRKAKLTTDERIQNHRD